MKNLCRLSVLCLAALGLAQAASAHTDGASASLHAVSGVRAFQLRADEAAGHEFVRTPSFAWSPMQGVEHYEFELSTSKSFTPNAVVWSSTKLKTPATSIPLALPWITGAPYSMYAHVRAVTRAGIGPWSAAYGFNMRWPAVAKPLPSSPGLIRWTPVAGATSYQVWFVNAAKIFATSTNVADEREYYTFHQTPQWTQTVKWRVRASRYLYGSTANGLPPVSYGPWSPTYTSTNPGFVRGSLQLGTAASDIVTPAQSTGRTAHALMPGVTYTGDTAGGFKEELYRVYIYTDRDCVNVVYKGAIVGSPAYAPRLTGPLALPHDAVALAKARTSVLPDGDEGETFTADYVPVTATESASGGTGSGGSGGTDSGGSGGTGSGGTGSGGTGSGGGDKKAGGSGGSSLPKSVLVPGAKIDLWDEDYQTGNYYWTVVPVEMVVDDAVHTTLGVTAAKGSTKITLASAADIGVGQPIDVNGFQAIVTAVTGNLVTIDTPLDDVHVAGEPVQRLGGGIKYSDVQVGQDACQAGQLGSFGKTSTPTVSSGRAPYATGLSTSGRLVAATHKRPVFYGAPLVSWQPAPTAVGYEVQWSHTIYPWKPVGNDWTFSTSALLSKLKPGTWYYRVRGYDPFIPGPATQLTWSPPTALQVAKPIFKLVSS